MRWSREGSAPLIRSHGGWRRHWGEMAAGARASEHADFLLVEKGSQEGSSECKCRHASSLTPFLPASLCWMSHPLPALPFASPHSHREHVRITRAQWGNVMELWKRGGARQKQRANMILCLRHNPLLIWRATLMISISQPRHTGLFQKSTRVQKLFFQMCIVSSPLAQQRLLDSALSTGRDLKADLLQPPFNTGIPYSDRWPCGRQPSIVERAGVLESNRPGAGSSS